MDDRLTTLARHSFLQSFTNREHHDLVPERLALVFAHSEGPRTTLQVTGVLPYRLHGLLEQMNRVPYLEDRDWSVVDKVPEVFHITHAVESLYPILVGRSALGGVLMPVKPKFPAMGEGRRAKLAMENIESLATLFLCGR